MVEISPRIQRLIVRSFPYQPFDVKYRKGIENIPLADGVWAESPWPQWKKMEFNFPIVAVNLIMSNLPVSSTEIELIHEETSKDPTLTLLRHYIHMGWPNDHRMLPQELHMFRNYREDFSMENGLITKGARLVIPSTLRKKVLEQIHDGHLGAQKQETLYSGQAFPMTSMRLWKNVEFFKQVPGQPNQLEMWVTCLRQWTLLQFQGVPQLPKFLLCWPHHQQPSLPTKQWICWSFGGNHQETDGKISERGKNLWNYGLLQYRTHIHQLYSSITIGDVDRKKTTFNPSTASIKYWQRTWKPPGFKKNCLGVQPNNTSTGTHMDLDPGQPVFVKEVSGNIWRMATVDQPAAESDSYWVRFPDNSILRRTRSMITPRSLPSSFQAAGWSTAMELWRKTNVTFFWLL